MKYVYINATISDMILTKISVINEGKCNIITFNFSSKNIGPQNLVLNGNRIYPVDKIKLLGVVITADLRWKENTAQLCKKVNKKLYILWKLKQFGVKQDKLVTAWKVLLRPIAEYAAPLWHPGLTASEIKKIRKPPEESCWIDIRCIIC